MIIPIVSTVYRSTTADTLDLTRICSRCAKASPAKVSVYSVGESDPSFLPLKQYAADAQAAAIAGLRPAAEHTLALAACPHCRWREPAAERTTRRAVRSASLLTSWSVIPLVLAAMTFMIAALVFAEKQILDGLLTALVGLAFIAVTWLVVRTRTRVRMRNRLDLADATVMWLGLGAQPEPAPVPVPVPARRQENGWPFA